MEKSRFLIGKSFKELLQCINAVPAGIAFIEDENQKLIGVFTDGDFRRALLNGVELNQEFKHDHLNEEFVYAMKGEDIQNLIKKTSKKVRIIPIVNESQNIIDYFRYEHKTHFTPVAEPSLKGNELEYVTDAVLSTWISSSGKYIGEFEDSFSNFCGSKYGVAVSNGTVAIHLALKALGIGSGDEVIIPNLTFAATANAVIHSNAVPVIVDVELDSWCINPDQIVKAITNKTKAIIPVHLYGQPCDMEKIMEIAKEHNLFVIEDAAEAHGATFEDKKVGSWGHISCFSFFANKIITTGEGGMCLTNSKTLNEKMRVLRDHGMDKKKKYWHEVVGFNYRMTNIQAAIGCAQMERIDGIIESRNKLEQEYKKMLSSFFDWQKKFVDRDKVVWLVCGVCKIDKKTLISEAKNNQIDIRPFFYPLSEMSIYKKYVFGKVDNSVKISKVGVNLPTVPNVDFEKLISICESIK